MDQLVKQINTEVEQLEYEKEQYAIEVNTVNIHSESLEQAVEKSSVKEHEIMVVTALIDEKSRLNEEKV